jgi:hypothetical protein
MTKVLVDTTIWAVSMLPTRADVTDKVRQLLRDDMIVAHEFVHGELLIGKGGSTRREVTDLYAQIPKLDMLAHDVVVSFIKKHNLGGKGISWVDLHLLASAHKAPALIWTDDKALKAAAGELKIAYEAGKS